MIPKKNVEIVLEIPLTLLRIKWELLTGDYVSDI